MDLALFDFDYTITHNDNWTAFLQFSIPPVRLACGKVLFLPLLLAYKAGLVSGTLARTTVSRFAFAGRAEDEIAALGNRYSEEVIPHVLQPQAMERIAWHKLRGDKVVVVSASLDVYLSHWCKAHGLDLICTQLEAVSGKMTGRYRGGDCAGHEKQRRVLEQYNLEDFGTVYAYGDSREDFELLSLADRKYFRWEEVLELPLDRI